MKKGNENGHQLLAHMELIDDELIENAALPPKKHLPKNRTWRTALPLAASFAVVVMVVIGVMVGSDIINTKAYESEVYLVEGQEEYWFVRPEPPYVDHEVAETIQTGMRAHEIIALIGKPNRACRAYSEILFQWDLDDGRCLVIEFCRVNVKEYGEDRKPATLPFDYAYAAQIVIADHSYEDNTMLGPTRYSCIVRSFNELESVDFESLWQNTDETTIEPESEDEFESNDESESELNTD